MSINNIRNLVFNLHIVIKLKLIGESIIYQT